MKLTEFLNEPQAIIIYKLTSSDGMSYIGQTRDIRRRIKQHTAATQVQSPISDAIRERGCKDFTLELLWQTPNDQVADHIETTAISFYSSVQPTGYNVSYGGGRGVRRSDLSARNRTGFMRGTRSPKASERMKKNNPMKNPKTVLVWKYKFLKNRLAKLESKLRDDERE